MDEGVEILERRSTDIQKDIRENKLAAQIAQLKPIENARIMLRLSDENFSLANRLRYVEDTDELTEIGSRKAFKKALEQSIFDYMKLGVKFTVVNIDLEGFKKINDRLSHLEGDRALKIVAKLFKDVIRTGDFVSRMGGDEFMILLRNADEESAEKVKERIDESLSQLKIENSDDQTVSMINFNAGYKVWGKDDTLESLMKEADKRMYEEKRKKAEGHND
jgi:diguanylate cyclase (GGDEF)-like protein